jgi:single-strand DNA-binding protein
VADYNLVVLVGRLTRDPELKYTELNGTAHTKLSMAIARQVAQPDGNYQKSVVYVDVAVWKHQAELACQVLKKGSSLLVSGFLESIQWTNVDGSRRSNLRVRAQRLQFLDKRGASADTTDAADAVAS